jgi:S-DNA-T family DNA segregation ATPase FtsK/SpoIIIE
MAKNTYKSNSLKKNARDTKKSLGVPSIGFLKDKRFQLSIGFLLIAVSVFMLVSFISYLFTGKADQSVVTTVGEVGMFESGLDAANWLGVYGAMLSHTFIFDWFGIASFVIPPFLFIVGFRIVAKTTLIPIGPLAIFSTFILLWVSLLTGYLLLASEEITIWGFLAGGVGFELASYFDSLIGWGTLIFLLLTLIVFIIYFFNVTRLLGMNRTESSDDEDPKVKELGDDGLLPDENDDLEEIAGAIDLSSDLVEKKQQEIPNVDLEVAVDEKKEAKDEIQISSPVNEKIKEEKPEPEFVVAAEKKKEQLGTNVEQYDPTLDLGDYKYPTLDLLNAHSTGEIQVTKEELEENKDKIIETLINFKIGISSIKATIGPTVTLY